MLPSNVRVIEADLIARVASDAAGQLSQYDGLTRLRTAFHMQRGILRYRSFYGWIPACSVAQFCVFEDHEQTANHECRDQESDDPAKIEGLYFWFWFQRKY